MLDGERKEIFSMDLEHRYFVKYKKCSVILIFLILLFRHLQTPRNEDLDELQMQEVTHREIPDDQIPDTFDAQTQWPNCQSVGNCEK